MPSGNVRDGVPATVYRASLLESAFSFLYRSPSLSGHPGAQLSDTCSGSYSLKERGGPGTPAPLGDARQSLVTHLRDQDALRGALASELESPAPRPHSSYLAAVLWAAHPLCKPLFPPLMAQGADTAAAVRRTANWSSSLPGVTRPSRWFAAGGEGGGRLREAERETWPGVLMYSYIAQIFT